MIRIYINELVECCIYFRVFGIIVDRGIVSIYIVVGFFFYVVR